MNIFKTEIGKTLEAPIKWSTNCGDCGGTGYCCDCESEGSGLCGWCGGTMTNSLGEPCWCGDGSCPMCSGTGVCSACGGTGE